MHRMKFTEFDQSHDAQAVEDGHVDIQPSESSMSSRDPRSHHARRMLVFLLFTALSALGIYILNVAAESTQTQDFLATIPFKHHSKWAQYSPYFPVERYTSVPDHCQVTQANIIQRHGARYPTSAAGLRIQTAVNKLLAVEKYTDARLDFLKSYTYRLGEENLVPLGVRQSQIAGQVQFARYEHLVSHEQLPFVRTSSSQRVIDSATNWTAGFSFASRNVHNPTLSVILPKLKGLNSTLSSLMCPNAGKSDVQRSKWLSEYGPPIAQRLNIQAPGANITPTDVYYLQTLCPFDSVFLEELSPFCNLFSNDEFEQYAYYGDVNKYYRTGYGHSLGPVQGVGYINELLARLMGTPVRDNTQTNRTSHTSPITFPLNRTIYADFSHDNTMIAIYAAMGLFQQRESLDPISPNLERSWRVSHMVPFSGRMVTEKLVCGHGKVFVRVLVNDALQPLEFCGANSDGLCTIDAFVESQAYARNDGHGDFQKCFE